MLDGGNRLIVICHSGLHGKGAGCGDDEAAQCSDEKFFLMRLLTPTCPTHFELIVISPFRIRSSDTPRVAHLRKMGVL
jgi:hypothetical protein